MNNAVKNPHYFHKATNASTATKLKFRYLLDGDNQQLNKDIENLLFNTKKKDFYKAYKELTDKYSYEQLKSVFKVSSDLFDNKLDVPYFYHSEWENLMRSVIKKYDFPDEDLNETSDRFLIQIIEEVYEYSYEQSDKLDTNEVIIQTDEMLDILLYLYSYLTTVLERYGQPYRSLKADFDPFFNLESDDPEDKQIIDMLNEEELAMVLIKLLRRINPNRKYHKKNYHNPEEYYDEMSYVLQQTISNIQLVINIILRDIIAYNKLYKKENYYVPLVFLYKYLQIVK